MDCACNLTACACDNRTMAPIREYKEPPSLQIGTQTSEIGRDSVTTSVSSMFMQK